MRLYKKGYQKITTRAGEIKYIPFALFKSKFLFFTFVCTFYIIKGSSPALLKEEDGFSDKWNWDFDDLKTAIAALDIAVFNYIEKMERKKGKKTAKVEKVYL